MSQFATFFPGQVGEAGGDSPLEEFRRVCAEVFRDPEVQIHRWLGAELVVSRSSHDDLRFLCNERGWIVVLGLLFDTVSSDPRVDLNVLLDRFLREEPPELNRYEGTFALAAWNAARRTGWIVNDQPSCFNVYFGESRGGMYASSSALPLARTLRLQLDPRGVGELLSRGTVLAPGTMFLGLRRLDVGEHVRYRAGTCAVLRHWSPYRRPLRLRGAAEAAALLADLALDRVRRYRALKTNVVADLTGGYDSRLATAAAHRAGVLAGVTVNGLDQNEDVRIAKLVAAEMGWPLLQFEPRALWVRPIDAALRRELTYRTNGELPFTEIYHHCLSRPQLAERYDLHFTGGGGELLRFFPWSQEFLGVGRRRRANLRNALRYRFFQAGSPPADLFAHDWHAALVRRFETDLERICAAEPDSRNTQQLDAVYIWRMTGFSPYTTATFPWLCTAAPLMGAGLLDVALAVPWKIRLTSRMMRTMIHLLAPRAAAVATRYGGTAGPPRWSNAHTQVRQLFRQSVHFAAKLDRVLLKGRVTGWTSRPGEAAAPPKPFLTREFRAFLDPRTMLSRDIYSPAGLDRVLAGPDREWHARSALILRIATIEQLCRELGCQPDPGLLSRL
jgi:hypothetical protein